MPLGGVALGDPYANLMEFKALIARLRTMENTFEQIVRNGVVIVDHANLLNIGTNDHDTIDTHIANGAIHFTDTSVINQVIRIQNSAPATDGTEGYIWINNTANPHISYILLNNGSGTAEWVQLQKGNP